MIRLAVAALAVASVSAFAAPSLTTPTSAQAGSTISFQATGSGNPQDFATIVPKGSREGLYDRYVYVKPGDLTLEAPSTVGEYEFRICAAASPYKTLLAKPIRIVPPQDGSGKAPVVKAPATIRAGAVFDLEWSGPANPQDYVGIGDADPNGSPYHDWKYTKGQPSPIRLTAPEKPGNYEVRYFLGSDNRVLAAQKVTVAAVAASVSAPAQVAAGAKFAVKWTGTGNPRDYVTVVKAGAPEGTWDRYRLVGHGNPLELVAPDVAGAYEVRYLTALKNLTLARATIQVGAVTGSLTVPAQAVAGESFKVGWKGPDNPRNYVTIVPKAAREGEWSASYAYTDKANPTSLVAPLAAGSYEVRYLTAESATTLARAAITIVPAKNEPGFVKVGAAKAGFAGGAVEIILDASGSMLQKLGAQRRIDIAKQTLAKLTSSTIPKGTPFALRVFGREVDSCQTDLDVALGPLDPAAVGARIQALVAKNGAKTPIGDSLAKAAGDLKGATGEKLIVLVTDGEETCGGDPAAAIAGLRQAGVTTRVSIVGFALDDDKLAGTFRRWADAGGGAFFDAKDAAGLDKSLTEAMRSTFEVVNAQGLVLASGLVGGEAVKVPAGAHQVRIKGRANTAKPVTVNAKETAAVTL
jgi:hypothetical protein